MKKILVNIFLILSIVLPYTCVLAENNAEEKHKEAIEFLTKLDVMSIVEGNEDFSSEKAVSREEFCVYLSRAFKIDAVSDKRQIFSDVPADSALASYVNSLYDKGIVSGFGGLFRPTDTISYDEAIKILITVLNYDYAGQMGGYPTGYRLIASSIGISEKVTQSGELTRGACAQLIYNAMTAPFMELEYIKGNNISFRRNEEKSVLTELYDFYEGKGVVLANSINALVAVSMPNDSQVVFIGDEFYKVGDTNASQLLGHYIKFYYRDLGDDEYEIVMITEDEAEELILKSDKIIGFENGSYRYEGEAGKIKKAEVDSDFNLSYNFSYPISGFENSMMMPGKGSVRLIKNANDSKYSTVIIEDYINYLVDSVDLQSEIIYTKDRKKLETKGTNFLLLDEDGNEITVSSVKEWNVISALTSSDGKKTVAYVSDKMVEGKASDIGGKDSSSISVGAEEYIIDSDLLSEIELGREFKFYFDYNDIISGIYKAGSEEMKYAYLVRKYIDNETMDDRVGVKLFEEDATVNSYYLAENVRINDVSYKNVTAENIVNNVLNVSVNLVKFQTNSSGEINNLYIYDPDTDKYIHELFSGKAYWNEKQRSFSGKVTMKTDALVFVTPEGYDAEDYQIRDMSSYENDTEVTVAVYTTGDNVYGDAILRNTVGVDYNRPLAIVKKVIKTVNDEGEPTVKLAVLYNSEDREYILEKEETLGTVDKGDVIKISLNHKKEINNILHVYDYDAGFLLSNPYEPQTGAGYRSRNRCYFGYAYDKTDGLLKYTKLLPSGEETPQTENALLSAFRIYVVDGDQMYIGDQKDIQDYTGAGSDCSQIIVSTMWGDPEDIVIIK